MRQGSSLTQEQSANWAQQLRMVRMGTSPPRCWCVPLQPALHWPALPVSPLHFANCLLDGSTHCICCDFCTSAQQHARRYCKACTAYSSYLGTALFEHVMQCCLLNFEAIFGHVALFLEFLSLYWFGPLSSHVMGCRSGYCSALIKQWSCICQQVWLLI